MGTEEVELKHYIVIFGVPTGIYGTIFGCFATRDDAREWALGQCRATGVDESSFQIWPVSAPVFTQ